MKDLAELGGSGPIPSRTITIVGAVDVAQALADNSLQNNLYWFDNNKAAGSKNLGTGDLVTAIRRGDDIYWLLSGLEVETSADIVAFAGPIVEIAKPVKIPMGPGLILWQGKISDAAETTACHYRLTLNLEGRRMETKLRLNILNVNPASCSEV